MGADMRLRTTSAKIYEYKEGEQTKDKQIKGGDGQILNFCILLTGKQRDRQTKVVAINN